MSSRKSSRVNGEERRACQDGWKGHLFVYFLSGPDRLVFPDRPMHFTILEPQNQEIGQLYVVQVRRATDFEARNLGKGRSG